MTSTSKNAYIGYLDDKVNEYNNTYHSTIKMKPANVTLGMYIYFAVENMINTWNLKSLIVLKYQVIKAYLQKGYTPNWSEDVFWIKK